MESSYERSKLGQFFYNITCNASINLIKYSWLYFLLQFTWGLLTNIIGAVVCLALLICGRKPKIYNRNIYFEVGNSWGGFSLGVFFVKCKSTGENTKQHENGHSYQNCIYGIFWLFLIGIPSMIRYWVRTIQKIQDNYYKIWFEESASKIGAYANNCFSSSEGE